MYDRLITCGCSHTFGTEMPDIIKPREGKTEWERSREGKPSAFVWPELLGDYLNIDSVINVAKGGGSGDFISRNVIKAIEQQQHKKILVGVMIPNKSRFEIIDNEQWLAVGPWYLSEDMGKNTRWVKHYYADSQHDFSDTYNILKNIHYMQMYLINKNIDYFFINAHKHNFDLEIRHDNLERFESIIDWSKFLDTYYVPWCLENNFEQEPGGHFVAEAHKVFVEQELGPWVKEKYL